MAFANILQSAGDIVGGMSSGRRGRRDSDTGEGGYRMPALKNPRWETFAQAIAAGKPQREAYREAFPRSVNWKSSTVDPHASRLAKDEKVLARYKELKEQAVIAAGGAVMSRNEKRELLARMARDETLPAADRQRAVDLDNKMEDEYTSNVNVKGNINNPMAGLTTEELRQLIADG